MSIDCSGELRYSTLTANLSPSGPRTATSADPGDRRLIEITSTSSIPTHPKSVAHEMVGGLGDAMHGAPTSVEVEFEPAKFERVDEAGGVLGFDAPEIRPVGQDENVAGEPIAADVRCLPYPVGEHIGRRPVQRPSPVGTADVVAPVGAHQVNGTGAGGNQRVLQPPAPTGRLRAHPRGWSMGGAPRPVLCHHLRCGRGTWPAHRHCPDPAGSAKAGRRGSRCAAPTRPPPPEGTGCQVVLRVPTARAARRRSMR